MLLCYVMLCYVMCYYAVMLCYVMLLCCYVMSCCYVVMLLCYAVVLCHILFCVFKCVLFHQIGPIFTRTAVSSLFLTNAIKSHRVCEKKSNPLFAWTWIPFKLSPDQDTLYQNSCVTMYQYCSEVVALQLSSVPRWAAVAKHDQVCRATVAWPSRNISAILYLICFTRTPRWHRR